MVKYRIRKNVYDEYVVIRFVNGVRDEAGTYYTNDLDDARATMRDMMERDRFVQHGIEVQ